MNDNTPAHIAISSLIESLKELHALGYQNILFSDHSRRSLKVAGMRLNQNTHLSPINPSITLVIEEE